MEKIGRYEIRRELGRGGMATVYEAYDPRFKREVAIKMLPVEFSGDAQFRARFEREAQTVAQLEHPAIVPVYDYGEENGRLYLVMRLMSGGSLADRLMRGPLPAAETGEIMTRLASALDAAHAHGIIHRDLKPANILFDQWGKPYLSDFGIVKLASDSRTALTQTGGLIGTPAYMSPEQVRGEGGLDGRSDIYALGIILFESLTGQIPFSAPTPMGIVFKHVHEPTPRLGSINVTVPSGCQRVIERAMAKNREERYPTAQAMANGLTQALTGQGNYDETMIEDDVWGLPGPVQVGQDVVQKKETGRSFPAWVWIGGAVGLVLCGIISAAAFIFFVSGNGNGVETTAAVSPEVVTVVVEGNTAEPVEEVFVSEGGEDEPSSTPAATPTPTLTPSVTATAEPSPTETPPPSATVSIVLRRELGRSTESRPINLISVGNGRRHIVMIGALHGNEPGTQALVNEMAAYFEDEPTRVDPEYTLHFIPNLNPDGLVLNTRYTSTGVDINRNWDTPNWESDAPQPDGTARSGGSSPLSEPETAALHEFFEDLLDDALSVSTIIYHAHTGVPGVGRLQPGYIESGRPIGLSETLANALIQTGGYEYVATCCGSYVPTGEISNWLAINGIATVDLELPSGAWPNQPEGGKTILQRAIDDLLGLMR